MWVLNSVFVAWWTDESRVPMMAWSSALPIGRRSYLTSLARMAFAGYVLGLIPPRRPIENEALRKKEDVSPYALLWDGMGKSAGIGGSQI